MSHGRMLFAVLAFTATGVFAPVTTAFAQWPSKPVALVVGSEPGSAPDVYARAVAGPMSRLLKMSCPAF